MIFLTMLRKVSTLLHRRKKNQYSLGLHFADGSDLEESERSVVQARLSTRYFPDTPGEVSQAHTFGQWW